MPSDEYGGRGHRPFDLDEWMDSVDGETVSVTAPGPNALGPEAARLMSSPVPTRATETWCENCEDYHRLVKESPTDVPGHCPRCGREPGILELGTTRGFEEAVGDA